MRLPKARTATAAAAAFLSSTSHKTCTISILSTRLAFALQENSNTLKSNASSSDTKKSQSFSTYTKTNMTCNNEYPERSLSTIVLDDSKKLFLYHFPSVGSTQDEAKKVLKEIRNSSDTTGKLDEPQYFAVSATHQVKGRGTKGRKWIGSGGNTFVTIGVPMKSIPIPINLFPLKIGTIIANQIKNMLRNLNVDDVNEQSGADFGSHDFDITLKWPNDVLIKGDKIAGVLIESEMDNNKDIWFLVGIGVNVGYAPNIETVGPHRGRKATCLRDHLNCEQDDSDTFYSEKSKLLAELLAKDLVLWISKYQGMGELKEDSGRKVVDEWKLWAKFGEELILRDKPGNEKVITLDIQYDGQLKVKDQNGSERLLVADYLL